MRRDEFLKKCNEFNKCLCDTALKKRSKREIIQNAMDFIMGAEIVAVAEMACTKGRLAPEYEHQRVRLQELIRRIKPADFNMDAFEYMIAWLADPDYTGAYPVFELGRRYLALNNALMYALEQKNGGHKNA